MSGTLCGIIDQRVYGGGDDAQTNQVYFKNLYEFFERMVTVGNATRVALQYGLSGTGTDYYDEANPFGENAFAVYKLLASASTERTIDLYVLIQWADASSFGSSPGNPGKCKNTTVTDGSGLVAAFRADGTSPWAGTTNNDGSDTKGSTVWTPGGSTLFVLDRCCSSGGTCSTYKENLIPLEDCTPEYVRVHMIGDADSIIIISDSGDAGNYRATYTGIYEPRAGLSPLMPCLHVWSTYNIPWNNFSTAFGTYNCGSYYEGGVLSNIYTDGVCSHKVGYFDKVFSTTYQPNSQISPVEFDAFPIFVTVEEVNQGLLGQLPVDMVNMVQNMVTNTTNVGATRAYFGISTQTAEKISVPWDGGNQPGTNTTREGRTF